MLQVLHNDIVLSRRTCATNKGTMQAKWQLRWNDMKDLFFQIRCKLEENKVYVEDDIMTLYVKYATVVVNTFRPSTHGYNQSNSF